MAVTTDDEPTGLMRFITGGGNPAQLSYETLARRRAIAAALAAKQRAFPKTLGEGMTYLGEALGEARNDRASDAMERTLGAREAAQRGALPSPASGLIGGGAAVAPPVVGAPMAAGAPAAGLPPVNAGQPSPLPPGPVGPLAAGPPPEEANPQRAKLATLIARLRGDETPAGQEAPPANPTEGAVMPPQVDPLSASTASPGPSGQQLAALGGTGTVSDAPPPGAGVPPLTEENPETPSNIMPAPPVRMAQAGGVIPGSVAPPVPAAGVLTPPGGGLFSGVPSTGGPPPGAPSTRPIPDLKEQTMEPPGAEPVRPGIPPPTAAMKYVFPLIDNPRVSPEQRAWAERVFKAEQAHQTTAYAREQETYKDQRELWQSKTKEYEKFQREKHDRLVDQTIKLHGIEKTQTELEDAYFKRGIPRQQAVEKADLEIKEAQRRLTTKPTKEIKGVIYEFTDPTPGDPGGWAIARGSPKEADNLTETQAKTVKFLQRATVARSQLGDANVLAGLVDTAKGKVPIGGNYAVSPAYQRAYSAANTWVSSVLRDESGALIGDKEKHAKILEYFPQPGDSEQVMRDKAFRRRAEEESLYHSLGDRKKVMDEWRASRTSRVVPRGPDGQQIYPEGTERVNKKTGARQRVMGGHWENEEDLR